MSDAEEQQRPARISKTGWARDAHILNGDVPDRLSVHLRVLSGVLAPGDERIILKLGPHFVTGTVTPGFE